MQNYTYDVIVIGAGISGIAASKILSANKIDHVILQSRDRVGGRIVQSEFQGVKVQLGASFVHSPTHLKNLIHQYIKQKGKQTLSAQYGQQTYFYQNEGILKQKTVQKGWEMYDKFQEYAKGVLEGEKDKTLEEAFQEFYKLKLIKKDQHVRNLVRWNVSIYGNIEGAELNQLSLKHYAYNNCESQEDYLPAKGYSSIVSSILSEFNPKILLSHVVTQINYEGQYVRVKTSRNEEFTCRKVISSLPLGVLQQQKVKFKPFLPQQYVNAIKTMGNGVADKLFVSLEKAFWGKRKGWLNFVTKSPHNRYRIAMILPHKQQKIMCIFVSGQASKQLSRMSEEEIIQDLGLFLSKMLLEDVKIKNIKLTRWHLDEHSLGSYSFCKGGDAYYEKVKVLKTPIEGKIWFIGEHTEELNACVHSAYFTGLTTAQKVCQSLRNGQKS